MKFALHTLLVFTLLLFAVPAGAQDDALLTASSMSYEETGSGTVITLEGPVEINFSGDRLTADSAVITLGDDLTSLEDAIISIELTGSVTIMGRGGERGRAGRATYYAGEQRIVLSGGVHFSQDDAEISAGSLTYHLGSKQVSIPGRCTITDGDITAEVDTAEYNLDDRTGSLSGNVVVTYNLARALYGDEFVENVIVRADALYVAVGDGEITTPSGPEAGRTTVDAGSFHLEADALTLSLSDSGIRSVVADGNVIMSGPDMQHLRAGHVSFSFEDRLLLSEGNVDFLIQGQSGQAESIEVNFDDQWEIRNIRLEDASISGELDGSTLVEEDNEPVDEESAQE